MQVVIQPDPVRQKTTKQIIAPENIVFVTDWMLFCFGFQLGMHGRANVIDSHLSFRAMWCYPHS